MRQPPSSNSPQDQADHASDSGRTKVTVYLTKEEHLLITVASKALNSTLSDFMAEAALLRVSESDQSSDLWQRTQQVYQQLRSFRRNQHDS